MIIDARTVPEGTVVETEVCIIGAGAAGITLAREFMGAGFRVALLESGGLDFDERTQDLYVGGTAGRPYLRLHVCRLRFFGGTTNHWAGWCVPFDEADFAEREGLSYRGWPMSRSDLAPYYERALAVCQVGPKGFEPGAWGIALKDIPGPFNGPRFVTKVLQVSPPTRFGRVYVEQLRKAPRLSVYLNANVLTLDANRSGREVREVKVGTLGGNRFRVRARVFVLASGGIENARLLLLSGQGLGNAHDLVGRFFMVHLEYSGGVIAVSDPYANFDFNRTYADKPIVSYVGLSDAAMRELKLANIRLTWEYELGSVSEALAALKRLSGEGTKESDTWSDLGTVLGDLDGVSAYVFRRALFGQGVPVKALTLRCHSEQVPNPVSRIRLGSELDALGQRRVVVDWRVTGEDKRQVNAIHQLLGTEMGRAGFGRLRSALTTDETQWPSDLRGNEHHMGTTRMHRDPQFGVVDENARVHGVGNLYVAGSSVFPTSGAANPTLTIVALALRLADHIKERMA